MGSRIAGRLTRDEHSLTLLDNFRTGSRLNGPAGVNVIEGDARAVGQAHLLDQT